MYATLEHRDTLALYEKECGSASCRHTTLNQLLPVCAGKAFTLVTGKHVQVAAIRQQVAGVQSVFGYALGEPLAVCLNRNYVLNETRRLSPHVRIDPYKVFGHDGDIAAEIHSKT